MSYDIQMVPLGASEDITRAVKVEWYGSPTTGINSQVAPLPYGIYVQQLPLFRHVFLKKPDGTWSRLVTVAGARMKDADGNWVIVGDF